MRVAELDFPGVRPQAKRAPQFRNGYAYVEKHYREWRDAFGAMARRQWQDMGHTQPIDYPIAVSVVFGTASGVMRGDLDNAFAGASDGLMDGGVLRDDKLIRRLFAEVRKVPRAGVGITIRIETLED